MRLEQRGPMDSPDLIALSPGAAAQLGLGSGKSPVRVRRVNPPETERALLRAGQEAPPRMSTPKPLLAVLQRKLTPDTAVQLAREGDEHTPPLATAPMKPVGAKPLVPVKHAPVKPHTVPPAPVMAASADLPTPAPAPEPTPIVSPGAPKPHLEHASTKPAKPGPTPRVVALSVATAPSEAKAEGGFVVQTGAYSVKANADTAAHKIDASVAPVGKLWRVRMGPFASRTLAEAALAKARAAGL